MTTVMPTEFPSKRTDFLLEGPAGSLECLSDSPDEALALPATAVLCHPHPLHGGTMHNKVVTIMDRALRESGVRTLRVNFRGVGESAGTYDDGFGETDDLLAAVDWVRRVRPDDELLLAGFSFGSYVCLRAAHKLTLNQLVLIAPPVERYEFAELKAPDCPWMVIQGDEDDVVSVDAVVNWAGKTEPPPRLEVMEEAGHFFHRRLLDLRGLIKNGAREHLPKLPAA
ncbi:MAG: alpha/beta fold hydrolase [Xanthomonadales bacterium]|nr:alpha/beta fold hydrolase [Xanthomonadales bacterium]